MLTLVRFFYRIGPWEVRELAPSGILVFHLVLPASDQGKYRANSQSMFRGTLPLLSHSAHNILQRMQEFTKPTAQREFEKADSRLVRNVGKNGHPSR